ncbi:rhodanese-like domain-containing protein [Paludibacterium yongneupense]|uniref:rhodanese-like domain-containing protein n=1 Tax=Paludibacterium yongneupense TaxID=400061 RepID=UPI00041EA781|nr:rhodanese-like domain-containing protein [Paludibacterium yongneupense]
MSTVTLEQAETQDVDDILERARERTRASGGRYRGALLPDEAWQLLHAHPRARLVDIRSSPEWTLIGSIPGAIQVQWKFYPDWDRNPAFLDELEDHVSSGDYLILLCRSGVRSREAAEWLTREGYDNVFNVLEGFEGDKNADGQRTVAGWKVRGLPWSH